MSYRIIIGADLVPTPSNFALFEKPDKQELIGAELTTLLESADFTIFNLEVPLTDKETPIAKCGPNLRAKTATIKGLHAINPYFFTLANNHILDQGEQGLSNTEKLLNQYRIGHAGTGKNVEEASKPYILESQGLKIGIYCCAEHEFSIATETKAGANPFDPLESLDHIEKLKRQCDYVIVLYHGGKEHYRYPSPYLQKVCRKIGDKGADLVVCQHSHCIGCKEEWQKGTIVYGQGNFLFDDDNSEYWQTSLLLELNIDSNKKTTIDYIPIVKEDNKVRKADSNRSNEILSEFNERSVEITKEGFIETKYLQFSQKMIDNYMGAMAAPLTRNILYRAFNKLTGHKFHHCIINKLYGKKAKLVITNFMDCEAHRELFLKGLEKK